MIVFYVGGGKIKETIGIQYNSNFKPKNPKPN